MRMACGRRKSRLAIGRAQQEYQSTECGIGCGGESTISSRWLGTRSVAFQAFASRSWSPFRRRRVPHEPGEALKKKSPCRTFSPLSREEPHAIACAKSNFRFASFGRLPPHPGPLPKERENRPPPVRITTRAQTFAETECGAPSPRGRGLGERDTRTAQITRRNWKILSATTLSHARSRVSIERGLGLGFRFHGATGDFIR